MGLAFAVSSDPFTAEHNPAITAKTCQRTTLKGNTWSRVDGLSPFFSFFLKNCSLIPLTLGGVKVKSVSAAPGPSWTVYRSSGSLLVQSYFTRSGLWEFLCSVIICDQAFDMRQFLMEVLAAFLFFPVPWKLLHTEKRRRNKWDKRPLNQRTSK